jgi:hypothetical protein
MARRQKDLLVVPQGGEPQRATHGAGARNALDLNAALNGPKLIPQRLFRNKGFGHLEFDSLFRNAKSPSEGANGAGIPSGIETDHHSILDLIQIQPHDPRNRPNLPVQVVPPFFQVKE